MEAPGDKMVTTHAEPSNTVPYPPAPKRGKHGKPVAVVKFGSASVPVYRCDSGGRVRFAISHYRDGKRLRKFFTTLEAAKKEAQFVAQRRHLHLCRTGPPPRQGSLRLLQSVFEKLMHNPGPEELEALLPVHWIRTQQSASQTIEVEVA